MFFSPPFSYSASLCEQLLAGGSGETPAYSFLEYCRITLPSNRVYRLYDGEMIGRLPYLYFLLLGRAEGRDRIGILPYCYFLLLLVFSRRDTQIGRLPYLYFLLLPIEDAPTDFRLEDCRIITSFYSISRCHTSLLIGRLPYYYFLLLHGSSSHLCADWKTAVFILPFTRVHLSTKRDGIGILPYLYFLLLLEKLLSADRDWKTAVFILPFTKRLENMRWKGLEHCRIYTSSCSAFSPPAELFDWKTAVLLLPFTAFVPDWLTCRLEYCRITISFYYRPPFSGCSLIGILPYYYLLLLNFCPDVTSVIGILPYY